MRCIVCVARLVDESARWLWSQGRKKDAVRVVVKASTKNFGDKHRSEINSFLRKDSGAADATDVLIGKREESPAPQMGIVDLFKTPNMCKRMFNVSLSWWVDGGGDGGRPCGRP